MLSRRRCTDEEEHYTTMAPRRTLAPTYEVFYRPARPMRPHELLTRFVSADVDTAGALSEDSDSDLSHVYEFVGKRKSDEGDEAEPRASKIPRLSKNYETGQAVQSRSGPAKAAAKSLEGPHPTTTPEVTTTAGASRDVPQEMEWQAATEEDEGARQSQPSAHPWAQVVDVAVRRSRR